MLNKKQRFAYDCAVKGMNLFITGKSGVGKSYTINSIMAYFEGDESKNVIVMAPTGIAAINVNGVTLHRGFRLKTEPLIEPIKSIPSFLKEVDVIIIDEISLSRIDTFDTVGMMIAYANKYRRGVDKADIQVIVVGDFFQLPPVITPHDREILLTRYPNLKDGYAFESEMWGAFNFVNIELDEVVRQNDTEFIANLNKLRVGQMSCIDWMNKHSSPKEMQKAIYVCSTNRAANSVNELEYIKLNSEEFVYEAVESGIVSESDKVVPDVVKLKKGARVTSVVNESTSKYVNGSLGIVVDLTDDSVKVLFDNGEVAWIGYNTWEIKGIENRDDSSTDNKNKKVKKNKDDSKKFKVVTIGTYRQIPLRLAYAITIHKSQGQTYDRMNLNPYCWSPGQLYVAVSRVRDISKLYLVKPLTWNYVLTSDKVKAFYKSLNFLGD